MASRKVKSPLIVVSEAIVSLDTVDATAPGGAAYKAFMLRGHILHLEKIASDLDAVK